MKRGRIIVAAIAVSAVVVLIWKNHRESDDESAADVFDKVVSEHIRISTPDGSQVTTPKETSGPWSRVAEWTINSNEPFANYKLWIVERMKMYRTINQSETHILLRRSFEAEIYDLEIRSQEDGKELQVRFTVSPW